MHHRYPCIVMYDMDLDTYVYIGYTKQQRRVGKHHDDEDEWFVSRRMGSK